LTDDLGGTSIFATFVGWDKRLIEKYSAKED